MVLVAHPPAFHHRVITQEAPGGPAQEVYLVAPTIVATDEPFRLRLAVLDADGYPSVDTMPAYCYVRVTCTSGAHAWSSPAWLLADG